MDTYVRRATRAFAALWSFVALVVVTICVLVGVLTEPLPDWFVVLISITTAFGGGVCGFLHGVTLSAARRLDTAALEDQDPVETSSSWCYTEYCQGGCGNRHS